MLKATHVCIHSLSSTISYNDSLLYLHCWNLRNSIKFKTHFPSFFALSSQTPQATIKQHGPSLHYHSPGINLSSIFMEHKLSCKAVGWAFHPPSFLFFRDIWWFWKGKNGCGSYKSHWGGIKIEKFTSNTGWGGKNTKSLSITLSCNMHLLKNNKTA